jgi:putative iron-regulated protein
MKNSLLLLSAVAVIGIACKKESAEPSTPSTPVSTSAVLNAFAANLAQDNYNDLAERCATLHDQIEAFLASGTDADLNTCRTGWRSARNSWEQSEGMLFGPVSTGNIDPRIDTWPVNFNDLEAQLASSNEFTADYMDGLEDALKGFHPIEYLIFGHDGNKPASSFTQREREYLLALSENLVSLTSQLATEWDPAQSNNYSHVLTTAGAGNTIYATQLAAFEEIVQAMSGICDEVANGKMNEPLTAQDPSLEESPFSDNSITDFTCNIRGVQNVYLGRYAADGAGLEDLVRQYDLQLDGTIKQEIATAISALENITLPFGEAIISQPAQVQQAIDAINALAATIDEELLPLMQAHIN